MEDTNKKTEAVERPATVAFFFPTYGKTIWATSREEAEAILQEEINKK